jgi:hypothetical protein
VGIGKPEPLRENLSGCWSGRIDDEHRLVYRLDGTTLVILACRYHYRSGQVLSNGTWAAGQASAGFACGLQG